jgi:AcrR family transcriptional regulator
VSAVSSKRTGFASASRRRAELPRWRRARRPEQKRERREAILAAAVELLDAEGMEGTTLSAIARGAGLSKANCYRYFETRESILLAVALEELAAWTREIEAGLGPLSGSGDVDAVAEVFVGSTARRPRLCMLTSSLASVLERNVGPDEIAHFKRGALALMLGIGGALDAALPGRPADASRWFATLFPLLVAGAWPAAHPTPLVAEVLARDELASLRIDFEATLRTHARALLRGLAARRE